MADLEVFLGDVSTPSEEESLTIIEGTGICLIGFLFDLIGEGHSYPIVRSGIIARIQDWLRGDENTFLIDAPAFPGNSGGPVIIRPDTTAIRDTIPITRALLIGMVSDSIRSRDMAVSVQTNEPRVILVENSGLSKVVPISTVKETLASTVVSLPKSLRETMGQ